MSEDAAHPAATRAAMATPSAAPGTAEAATTPSIQRAAAPTRIPVRSARAFSHTDAPTPITTMTPASPPRKTIEIRKLVSPTRYMGGKSEFAHPRTPPHPTAGTASDGTTLPPRPVSATAAATTAAAVRRSTLEWQEAAAKLTQRVKELERENMQLKQGSRVARPPNTFAGGEMSSLIAADKLASASSRKISKSQSFANGFGHTGYTVAEAAAASHRSRSKRQQAAKKPMDNLRAGYWNPDSNIKSSFSCNNLSEMEPREFVAESLRQPLVRRPLLEKSHSTNTRSMAIANRDAAALMNSFSNNHETPQRVNGTSVQGDDFGALHKQQLAMNRSFRVPHVLTRQGSAPAATSTKLPRAHSSLSDLEEVEEFDYEHGNPMASLQVTSPRSYVEAGLRTGGSFRPNKKPQTSKAQRPSSKDVKMWVGTWNMGAADPFADGSGIIDEQRSAAMLQSFIPHGYQLYILGVQEGVSENVYHAVEAYLNRNERGARYYRMTLKNGDCQVPNKSYPAETVMDAVHGRGDGAFMGTKFTGLAVFYCADLKEKVKLVRVGVHKFNLTSGSKGGVAVALLVNQTTVVFVNCHLDARNDAYRREQIRNLNANLGRIMGHYSFDLTEQFHHVLWMGDMNYRIVFIDPPLVLHMLEEGRNLELHEKFDGLLNDRRNGGVFEGFTEPHKFADFYPTYKKFPKRGFVNEALPSWPALVYRVLYKEPFYKGGKVKKRVPGWCDRILIHSMVVSDSKLAPEQVLSPFDPTKREWIDNYRSVNHGDGMDVSDHSPVYATFVLSFPQRRNPLESNKYSPHVMKHRSSRSLSTSGTDPSSDQYRKSVSGSYFDQARVVHHFNAVLNRPVSSVLRVFNMQLYWNENSIVPKRTRVVAPLVGEDTTKQCDVIGERLQGSNGINLSLNAVITHSRPLEQLHMLVWVRNDAIIGHCTLPLKRIARQEEGGEVKFRLPLYHNSMRLYHENHPLLVVFSVRSKTFAK